MSRRIKVQFVVAILLLAAGIAGAVWSVAGVPRPPPPEVYREAVLRAGAASCVLMIGGVLLAGAIASLAWRRRRRE